MKLCKKQSSRTLMYCVHKNRHKGRHRYARETPSFLEVARAADRNVLPVVEQLSKTNPLFQKKGHKITVRTALPKQILDINGWDGKNRRKTNIIPMLLWCPLCHARHIDEGEFAAKEHHAHACQNCGMVWRPAIVPTCGVKFLPGYKDGLKPSGSDQTSIYIVG